MRALLTSLLLILGFATFSAQDNDEDTIANSISLADNMIDPQDEAQNISRRIFGGEPDFANDYNFVARLTIDFNTRMRTVCSGVVLTTKIIITVAHCLKRPGGEMVNRVRATLPRGGQYIFLRDEVLINPSYRVSEYGADVALLRKNTRLTEFMRGFGEAPNVPLQTDAPYTPASGEPARIVGWGQSPGSTLFLSRLRWARVSLITTQECELVYSNIMKTMNENEMLCTGATVAGACTGDWGGPLLTEEIETPGSMVLRGLTIYKKGPCFSQDNVPTAYISVETAANWIRSIEPTL